MKVARCLVSGVLSASLFSVAACSTGEEKAANGPSGGAKGTLRIAYLPGAANIPYFAVQAEALKAAAKENGAEVTVIDSGLDSNKQIAQLESLISSGQYDGAVIVPLSAPGLVPVVKKAIKAGMVVGSANVAIGTDPETTDTQVDGVAVFSGRPYFVTGTRLGQLTEKACADRDPCKVGFLYGIKAAAYDQALYAGYTEEIQDSSNITIAAEGESQYSRAGGLTATQNLIQAHPDIDVLVAVDQAADGAQAALDEAGLNDVAVIGFGGSKNAVEAVQAGEWFGDVVQMPVTEGELALQGVVDALRAGTITGYVDPVVEGGGPADSIITQQNASDFTAQYDG